MSMYFGPRGELVKVLLDILHEIKQYDEELIKLEGYEHSMLKAHIKDKLTVLKQEEREIKTLLGLIRHIKTHMNNFDAYWDNFEDKLRKADPAIAKKEYFDRGDIKKASMLGQHSLIDLKDLLVEHDFNNLKKFNRMKETDLESEIKTIFLDVKNLLLAIKNHYARLLEAWHQAMIPKKVFDVVYEYLCVERKHELPKDMQELE